MMASSRPGVAGEISRKKSLIRPERNRIDPNHPNYYYRKHAQGMDVQPSSTGNDPIAEDPNEAATISSDSTDMKPINPEGRSRRQGYTDNGMNEKYEDIPLKPHRKASGKLRRKATQKELRKMEEERLREWDKNRVRPPSLWNVYCGIVTFWCPDAVLRCFGKPSKLQQRAWREKMGLLSIIMFICAFVGYLTFGFTQTVCPVGSTNRIEINKVDSGYMIFHGKAYDLSRSTHPLARGVPPGANVLFDLDNGGKDGSFLFQNVNGACKGLITKVQGSDVVTNSDGELSWYFPCTVFNQDGSSQPNVTEPYYSGYACHTSADARKTFYDLKPYGDVFFTWDEVRNKSRNLMVYGSDVLDLNLLGWFNKSAVAYPTQFDSIRTNKNLRGIDVTRYLSTSKDRQIAQCMTEIIKVGSVDTATIGCIASKVVLYVSLVFILAIVVAKFLLALCFQWFLCRKFGATKTTLGTQDSKTRKKQIEDWSDDIYRPAPPKIPDANPALSDRGSKRGSQLFPSTSRFTSPYAIERSKNRPPPTTMASQSSTSRLLPGSALYKQGNYSQGTLGMDSGKPALGDGRASAIMSGSTERPYSSVLDGSEGPGPAGFVHEKVNPQPPPDWEPFGYPLAHAICLVTAYSEGAEGLRTTLDSVATTDYPKSHKILLVICDGMIRGKGESMTTPDICLAMMKDHTILPDEVQAFSYVAVASGSKRHNMAKIYSGFYDYGRNSSVPLEKQERVPMMLVVKCGTPDEASTSKPGNRGKRDSQVVLMSFLQKVMFDERMTELEFEMFNGIWKITGISPDFYEVVLMVDADTKIFPDSLTHMISAMVKDPEIMGLCGETKIANKRQSWVSMIQVFE
jgi:chitin synthase